MSSFTKPLSHDPLRQINERLWSVEGDIPLFALRRRMSIAKRADGRLVIHNGIAADAATMQAIEALGEPAFLLVPSRFHRLDAAAYKARYPQITVLCPHGAAGAVQKKVAVDGTYDDLPPDEFVSLSHFAGMKGREGVMRVRADEGVTAVVNDVLFHYREHLGGLTGLALRAAGATKGLRISHEIRWLMVSDKKALRSELESLAAPALVRLLVAHGAPLEEGVVSTLQATAATL